MININHYTIGHHTHKLSSPHTIMPITHHEYVYHTHQPFCPSAIKPITHYAIGHHIHQPSWPSPMMHINHHGHWPTCLSLIIPVSDHAYQQCCPSTILPSAIIIINFYDISHLIFSSVIFTYLTRSNKCLKSTQNCTPVKNWIIIHCTFLKVKNILSINLGDFHIPGILGKIWL